MSKFAPANDEGNKPYVVTQTAWGNSSESIVYADTAASATWAFRRMLYTTYKARRATPDDIRRLS